MERERIHLPPEVFRNQAGTSIPVRREIDGPIIGSAIINPDGTATATIASKEFDFSNLIFDVPPKSC